MFCGRLAQAPVGLSATRPGACASSRPPWPRRSESRRPKKRLGDAKGCCASSLVCDVCSGAWRFKTEEDEDVLTVHGKAYSGHEDCGLDGVPLVRWGFCCGESHIAATAALPGSTASIRRLLVAWYSIVCCRRSASLCPETLQCVVEAFSSSAIGAELGPLQLQILGPTPLDGPRQTSSPWLVRCLHARSLWLRALSFVGRRTRRRRITGSRSAQAGCGGELEGKAAISLLGRDSRALCRPRDVSKPKVHM